MNFVFEDAQARRYIGTAGHCFDGVGQRAEAEPEPGSLLTMLDPLFEFGSAVHVEFSEDEPSIDFALIEIDSDQHENVNPAVRSWGGPAGSTTADETHRRPAPPVRLRPRLRPHAGHPPARARPDGRRLRALHVAVGLDVRRQRVAGSPRTDR